jgi:hypothetical protein
VIAVYAITLDLDGPQALAAACAKIGALAAELDPQTALVECAVSDGKPAYRAAGLLHGGEPRLPTATSRFTEEEVP